MYWLSFAIRGINESVIFRLNSYLWVVIFFVSCDKPQELGEPRSTDGSKPRTTRADRSRSEAGVSKLKQRHDVLAAAKKIEVIEDRDKAFAEFAWSNFESDPDISAEAFGLISTDSVEKIPLIEFYAMQLAAQNPNEALAWAASLGSKKESALAKAQIIQVLANNDPQHAARLLPKPAAGPGELDNTTLHVLHRWLTVTPPDAAAWAASFPAGDAREVAIKAVVGDWTQKDPQAAFSWLATLTNPGLREEAHQAMIETFAEQPQEVREAWFESADPSLRKNIEQGIAEFAAQPDLPEPPPEPEQEAPSDELEAPSEFEPLEE